MGDTDERVACVQKNMRTRPAKEGAGEQTMPFARHPAVSPGLEKLTSKQNTFNNSLDDAKPCKDLFQHFNTGHQETINSINKKNKPEKNRKYLV